MKVVNMDNKEYSLMFSSTLVGVGGREGGREALHQVMYIELSPSPSPSPSLYLSLSPSLPLALSLSLYDLRCVQTYHNRICSFSCVSVKTKVNKLTETVAAAACTAVEQPLRAELSPVLSSRERRHSTSSLTGTPSDTAPAQATRPDQCIHRCRYMHIHSHHKSISTLHCGSYRHHCLGKVPETAPSLQHSSFSNKPGSKHPLNLNSLSASEAQSCSRHSSRTGEDLRSWFVTRLHRSVATPTTHPGCRDDLSAV